MIERETNSNFKIRTKHFRVLNVLWIRQSLNKDLSWSFESRYIDYYKVACYLFFYEIKTNNLFIGGQG
jgi:hypothetical protein